VVRAPHERLRQGARFLPGRLRLEHLGRERRTDVSIARAIELGGTLVHGPDDSPHGRLATIADPTGVRFRLQGPNA